MKMIVLALVLFLTACNFSQQAMSIPELDLKLSEEWIYAEKILNLKSNGVELTRPPGFEQLVMELIIPQAGGLLSKKHCVYYVVAYKEKRSHFKVVEMKTLESCPDISSNEMAFISVPGLDHFKVTFANFKMTLEFIYKKEKKTIEIPMANVEAGRIHEKYHAIKEKRLMSGLKYLRLGEDSFDFGSNQYLGKLSDRFSRNTAIRCQRVDKNCETIGENRCEQCRYGWYEVVDFQCPQGGSKFCGQNHCGEKNEPACPRGTRVVDIEDAGICQNDLEPVMNADKILVCQ